MEKSGDQGSNIENDDQEKEGSPSYRQSAEVCDTGEERGSEKSSNREFPQQETPPHIQYTAASQRIYAKEL